MYLVFSCAVWVKEKIIQKFYYNIIIEIIYIFEKIWARIH